MVAIASLHVEVAVEVDVVGWVVMNLCICSMKCGLSRPPCLSGRSLTPHSGIVKGLLCCAAKFFQKFRPN